jgi:hypothetical protein
MASLGAAPAAFGGSDGGCSGGFSNGGPSAVAQYIEQVPTSCGSNASVAESKAKLPRKVTKKLRRTGGSDAKQLETIATSTRYGAPSQTVTQTVKKSKAKAKAHARRQLKSELPRSIRHPGKTRVTALSGFGGVVADGSDSRLIALVAIMALTALAAGVTAIVRRRSSR